MAESARTPETRDVSPRAMLIFAACFVAFLAATIGGMALLFDTSEIWPRPGAAWKGNDASPALQRTPENDLTRHLAREDTSLHTLAWVDRKAGIARIPIEEAMRIVAARGLPDWGGTAATASAGECAVLTGSVPRAPQAAECRDPPKPVASP